MTKGELLTTWQKVLKDIEVEIGNTPGFKLYLVEATPLSFVNRVLHIEVKNTIIKTMIEARYAGLIKNSFHTHTGFFCAIAIHVQGLDDPFIPQFETKNNLSLDDKYVFDNFIVGPSNQFAHATAQRVAGELGTAYNPLFIYGGVGLGKTHLMQAIGNHVASKDRYAKIEYLTAETFTNEFIESLKQKNTEEFREKYRSATVLLLDDIQFLSGKKQTEEQLFHTFNALYQANRQVVITSDRPPKELVTIEKRLRNRFEWGIIADVNPPEYETRLAILRRKAQIENVDLDDAILDIIADKIKSNVRELEGVFKKIVAKKRLSNRDFSIELAYEALSDYELKNKARDITPSEIIHSVSQYYNVPVEQIMSDDRKRELVYPRQIAMYLCKELTGLSSLKLSEIFERDHSTVLYGVKKINNKMRDDMQIKRDIDSITEDINEDTVYM